jgi:hypothetical protein
METDTSEDFQDVRKKSNMENWFGELNVSKMPRTTLPIPETSLALDKRINCTKPRV